MFFIKKRALSSLDHLTDRVRSTAEEETSAGDRQDQGQAKKMKPALPLKRHSKPKSGRG